MELPREERIQVDKLIDRIYDDMEEGKFSIILIWNINYNNIIFTLILFFSAVASFLNNEGSGLYILQSSVNHSCVPNAIVEFPYSNNVLVLKAIRDIHPEEEICISYLDECCLERSRHSRQKALNSLYLFQCYCNKCLSQANDLDLTSEDEIDDNDDMSSWKFEFL